MLRAPAFWWNKRGLLSRLLFPFGFLYGALAAWRMRQPGQSTGLPVICVGNFTLGGSGKTPTAIALVQWLKETGETPFVLTRGYGGKLKGPILVDPAQHNAADVGDEPLLLVRHAPVIVARDRVAGAQMARVQGATVIVMDDGLQNPSLKKDFSLAVVDGRRGLGNCCVFPAGPLRAPLAMQLDHVDAVLVIGGDRSEHLSALVQHRNLPVIRARLEPDGKTIAALGAARALAFAGIGDPDKFFASLSEAGVTIAARESFADHHPYSEADAARLLSRAEQDQLLLITTEKDKARLRGQKGALARLHERAQDFPVRLVVEQEEDLRQALRKAIAQR